VKAALISDQLGEEERALRYLQEAQKCSGIRNEHTRLTVEALEARITKPDPYAS
jgi:hypothetical protein